MVVVHDQRHHQPDSTQMAVTAPVVPNSWMEGGKFSSSGHQRARIGVEPKTTGNVLASSGRPEVSQKRTIRRQES